MPTKYTSHRVHKADHYADSKARATSEEKAADRAARLEARRLAKLTQYVPKARTKRNQVGSGREDKSVEPATQVLTFTEEHTRLGGDDVVEEGGWLGKGYRWYTSLVGFSVFTPSVSACV